MRPWAPCTWIARSMTLCSIRAPTTLIVPISMRAWSPASIFQGHLAPLAAALDLVDVHVVKEREPASAQLLRVPESPQALLLGLLAQVAQNAAVARVQGGLGGLDPLGHELVNRFADALNPVGHGEQHQPPAVRSVAMSRLP